MIRDTSLIVEELLSFDDKGRRLLQTKLMLDYKVVTWEKSRRKVWQFFIQWQGISRKEASGEDYDNMTSRYPHLIIEGKDMLEGRMSKSLSKPQEK